MKSIFVSGGLLALLAAFVPLVKATAAPPESAPAAKLIYSFEDDSQIKDARLNHAAAVLSGTGATQGKQALQVTFSPPANYPGFGFPIPQPLDWSGAGGLALDVTNPGKDPFTFALRIDTAVNSDGSSNSRTGSARIEPGKTVSLLMPFNVDPVSPDMSKVPDYVLMHGTGGAWSPFNLANIVAMQIFIVKPAVDKTLCFDNLRLIPALPPVPQPSLQTQGKQLLSFESPGDLQSVKTVAATTKLVTGPGVTSGKSAIGFQLEPTTTYPNVSFPFAAPQDLRGYGGLAMDITNPGENSISFGVRIDCTGSAGGTGDGARQGGGSLEGGKTATFLLPFGIDAAALGMKTLPGLGAYRSLGARGSGNFDLGSVATWQIFLVRPIETRQLIVDNVRVVPGEKQDFNKIIDRYGQFSKADWPGKIHSDKDFQAQTAAEDLDLRANANVADRDKYGGWSKGPQLKATGFFRAEKYQGKWSFVDPDGHLFLSFGVDSVSTSANTIVSGRDYMFEPLPKNDEVAATHLNARGEWDILGTNLERKYGKDFANSWYQRSYERLQSWGFNTLGAFSSWDTLANGKVPYTATLWVGSGHARVGGPNDAGRTMDDPYDPKFAVDVASAVRGQARRTRDDPYFLGYFVGNEESWGYYRNGPRSQYALILGALKSTAAASPAKRAVLAQLQVKYADIARLNAAWGTSFADWAALTPPVVLKEPYTEAQLADFSAALKDFAEVYFRTVAAEIKKADPNHLYLGCRFAGYSPEILDGAARHCDVISFNIYRLNIDPKAWTVLEPYDVPVLVGEYHFGATDRGMFDSGLGPVEDQAARGRAFQGYVRSVVDNPKFVGAHWFQYVDQPTTGRPDGENGNVGFVSITDTPYPEIIKAAREVHAEMYRRRYGKP